MTLLLLLLAEEPALLFPVSPEAPPLNTNVDELFVVVVVVDVGVTGVLLLLLVLLFTVVSSELDVVVVGSVAGLAMPSFRLFGSIPLNITSSEPVFPLFSTVRSNVFSKLLTIKID